MYLKVKLHQLLKSPMIMADILKIVNSDMFDFKGSIDNIGESYISFDNSFIINIAIGSVILNSVKNLFLMLLQMMILYSCALASNIVNLWVSKIDIQLKDELLLPAFVQGIGKYLISDVIQSEKKTEIFKKNLKRSKKCKPLEERFATFYKLELL